MNDEELSRWFEANTIILETAYLAGTHPWQQSGVGLRTPHGLKSFKTQLRLGGQARAQVVPVYSSGQSSLRSAAPWQPGLQ